MRTWDDFLNFLAAYIEAWLFLRPARKGPGAACTELHILHLCGSLSAYLCKKMQRIPGPRAFTIHFRDRKKREEEAAYGEQSPSRSHYWPHIQMRVL